MASNVTKSDTSSKNELTDFEKDLTKTSRSLFWIILSIIWFPFRVVLYPFTWVGKQFLRMSKFLTNKSSSPLNYEEISLVESVPVFFTLASIDLAIILGIIASIGFSDRVKKFLASLTNGLDGIKTIITGLYEGIVWIIQALYNLIVNIILGGIWNIITSIQLDPIMLLITAIVFAIILIVVIMVISELDIIGRLMRKLGYFGLGIAELPYALYESLNHLWDRIFLKTIGRFISSDMVTTKRRTFYRRIIVFITLYAIWTFAWGLLIMTQKILEPTFYADFQQNPDVLYQQMSYFIIVIILSGLLAGTALMYVLSRVLKVVTKNRYDADEKDIQQIRYKSLLDYMEPKRHLPSLSLSDVSRLVDISKQDMGSYFKDKALKNWKLVGNAIVNEDLYKERMKYVDGLVDKGLDEEEVKFLTKAIDYLTFMEKGLRNVSTYVSDIEDKKELINEDIADLRGLYGKSQQSEAA